MNYFSIVKVGLAALLAVIPACVWGYIFWKKQVGQKSMTLATFVAGALFVTPLLIYKGLWQYFPWINAFQYTHSFKDDLVGFSSFGMVPLDVILTFMIVGVIEEVTKLWAVKITDRHKIIRSIDDAIEMSIMAALGFSFAENMLYFYNIMSGRGIDEIMYPFIFRSLFSTFAHVMFSGVLGYYYGLALFATDVVREEHNKKRWPVVRWVARLLHMKMNVLFHEEKMAQGLLIAVGLHAVFNIFLEMNWTFLLVPFLTGGFIYVSWLLEKKEDHKIYATVDENRNDLLSAPDGDGVAL
jgi:RsiW-degrading membrane proteinase PrsW (M82 family)